MVEKNVTGVVEKVVKAATRAPRKPKVIPTGTSVVTMTCDKLPTPIGPFSLGKMIVTPNGTWAYSSGQLGISPKT